MINWAVTWLCIVVGFTGFVLLFMIGGVSLVEAVFQTLKEKRAKRW